MSDTVGKISSKLIDKPLETNDPIEQMREQLEDYESNIFQCIARYVKVFPLGFYIVVLTKRERLMPNVFRHYFFGRQSCPTPDYDQTVYKYSPEKIEFLWVIPSKAACIHLKENALTIDKTEQFLLKFVLEFADCTLYNRAKQLNGEE